jgi:pyruvate kinase
MATRRATKLVCTVGPASEPLLFDLVTAGMDVARVNLSHGTQEDHERLLKGVREAAAEAGRPVAILADLSGPKVRLGELLGEELRLERGSRFVLRTGDAPGEASGAPTTYPGLAGDLEPGDRVLLTDGAVELRVVEVANEVVTEVVRGGSIRSGAGVNVPAERLGLPAITSKDETDIEWALSAEVDMMAQSFVRRAEEVRALRSLLGREPPLLVAKIETGPAVRDAGAIIEAADAVMVARGDLGVELPLEEIPLIQRDLVSRAARAGVPVIVATQMLESMTRSARPTRAEVSDVAAAVFEGADAIMLSAETAIGAYPIEATQTAVRIAEVAGGSGFALSTPAAAAPTDAHLVAQAAATVCVQGGVIAVACATRSGRTASLLSAARPRVPIYAFSPNERAVRKLTLSRGVHPSVLEHPQNTDALIEMMDTRMLEEGLARVGDAVVMVTASPFGAPTNLLKIHHLGSSARPSDVVQR